MLLVKRTGKGFIAASDPDDGPDDPNDDAAVDRFLTEANRIHPIPSAEDRKVAQAS